jgi:hypothetical protein
MFSCGGGNLIYKQDKVGFLFVNFKHLLHEFDEPFVFPSQVQQVFFWSEPKTPWWKVVFHKKPKSWQVVANTCDDCIDMRGGVVGFEVLLEFVDLNINKVLVGAIELNREETFLVVQALCGNFGMDDVA